jgi:DNA topoisomerase-2
VLFQLTIPAEINTEKGGLHKKLKLDSSISTTNMNCFDMHQVIRKFESPIAILEEFYRIRVRFYEKRKAHLMEKLADEWSMFDNKCRFIKLLSMDS